MSQILSYYCDTPHTQQLMGLFGPRLRKMERADLLDFVTIFSAACNTDSTSPHSEYELTELAETMEIVPSVHIDAILEMMDGFDRGFELSLLFGLGAMLFDRGKE